MLLNEVQHLVLPFLSEILKQVQDEPLTNL
jgi:hypothetical protein